MGKAKGIREGYREAVLELLKSRFREIPEDVSVGISVIQELQDLKSLLQKAVACNELDDFRQVLFALKVGRHPS